MGTSHYGCFLTFTWDTELADAYYFENYNNTNKTMLSKPYIPMRADTFKEWSKRISPNPYLTVVDYKPGLLKDMDQQGNLAYIWRTSGIKLRVVLVAVLMIILTGVFGKNLTQISIYLPYGE